MMNNQNITSLLQEERLFEPSEQFKQNANFSSKQEYDDLRKYAHEHPLDFWEQQAQNLHWFESWKTILEWDYPNASWFKEGKINASYNCLDRHINSSHKDKIAIYWEGEPGDTKSLTYSELHKQVCKMANGLLSLGIKKGDIIAIYMGMIPEAIIAMLACARIGATHNVIFGGFSADSLRDRIQDSQAKCLITQDIVFRKGIKLSLKQTAQEAVLQCNSIQSVIIFQRTEHQCSVDSEKEILWHDLIEHQSDIHIPQGFDSEHPLFILYTSGSTGKPKGLLHTTGGYLTQAHYTFSHVFDIKNEDIFFCTADIGWITGHSYVAYGPLSAGATILIYEGVLVYPDAHRIWNIIEKYKATILYTAPTAIRTFLKLGDQFPLAHNLSSLRLLGTVGEPINPEAWIWYKSIIGKNVCPIVDTWWQTETGGIMIAPIPGIIATKPGSATLPLPGIIANVVHKDGSQCEINEGGYLVIMSPWPGMARTIFGDNERYKQVYWSEYPPNTEHKGYYFTGDGARIDKDGYFWIMGRVDDVVNVSGHRLGTAEVESALVSHPAIAEAAVIAKPDEIKGNVLIAFVTIKQEVNYDISTLKQELKDHVSAQIGSIARPEDIRFVESLPKTRSGKIMRRLLRELSSTGVVNGDTTTLEDFNVLDQLREEE
ncbi:MAG: acetate--CoA ligase [Bacteroidota bacterium]